MILPFFGILFLLFSDDDAAVRRKHREPSFDRTGMDYHEPLERMLAPEVKAADMSWWLPWTNGDSLQFVAANHVKVMQCASYEPNDTVVYYSDYWKREITEYQIGGMHNNLRWDFDRSGRLSSFICFKDTSEKSVRSSRYFTYDDAGFLTSSSTYSLEDGISKQYRGYTHRTKTRYKWSSDHRVCDVDFDSKLVSLPGTSRQNRKYWDSHRRIDEHWEFNSDQKPGYFKGDYFRRHCEMNFSYNAEGDLSIRTVKILGKSGGSFADSITWNYSGGNKTAQHFFVIYANGKSDAELLETVVFNQNGQIIMNELGPTAAFPDDEFDNIRGRKYVVTYEGEQIIRQEERDPMQQLMVGYDFTYSRFNDRNITTTSWLERDTSRIDTIRVVKTYTMDNGLITAIDVHNREGIYWKGTWFFPEYVDLNDFECYRFRYEFY